MLHAWDFVAHFLLWHDLMPLKLLPSLQPQSNGEHSLPALHASPGDFGPVVVPPSVGVVVPLPFQPP